MGVPAVEYFVGLVRLPHGPRLELQGQEYDEVIRAKENLVRVLEIEEAFDVLVENYAEFQGELLALSVWHGLHREYARSGSDRLRRLVNRRLGNLLSSCRLYFDLTDRMLGEAFPQGRQSQDFNDARSLEYDDRFSYRLLEAVRNYSQHRGFAVQDYGWRLWREEEATPNKLCCSVQPKVIREDLRNDPKVKADFRKELDQQPETISLGRHVVAYMESIYCIHNAVRSMIEIPLGLWEDRLSKIVARFAEKFPEEGQGCSQASAYMVREGTADPLETFLTAQFHERITFLQESNPIRTNLAVPLPGWYSGQDGNNGQ